MKFENIDIIEALRQVMDIHTEHYKEDFKMDAKLLQELAASPYSEDKQLLWMSRPNGTYLLREREVYVENSPENKTWEFYHEQTNDPIIAFAVKITGVEDGVVKGNLIELDYATHVERMQKLTVTVEKVAVNFPDQTTHYVPFKSSHRDIAALKERYGEPKSVTYLPENEGELAMILRREHFKAEHHALPGDFDVYIQALARQHIQPVQDSTETLADLPANDYKAYLDVKAKHPSTLVCFAQNSYFELYGDDARKAAPLLGSKLLEKKVEGHEPIPVTGFKEAAWVAGSYKLWKAGEDVFLSKYGETFKELKGADYIPVGATLKVGATKCRIDAVDFAADKVTLTNLEVKDHPVRYTESIAYVRSFVEDAGIAVYDTIPKEKESKPKERSSIREKLKAAKQEQPKKTPTPKKQKGKDVMEL